VIGRFVQHVDMPRHDLEKTSFDKSHNGRPRDPKGMSKVVTIEFENGVDACLGLALDGRAITSAIWILAPTLWSANLRDCNDTPFDASVFCPASISTLRIPHTKKDTGLLN
jgi:hypothetical protein